jgi:hypothetical protein
MLHFHPNVLELNVLKKLRRGHEEKKLPVHRRGEKKEKRYAQ